MIAIGAIFFCGTKNLSVLRVCAWLRMEHTDAKVVLMRASDDHADKTLYNSLSQ